MSFISKTKLNNKGFSHLEIGITIVVVAVIAVVGGFVYNKNHNKSKAMTQTPITYTDNSNTPQDLKISSQAVKTSGETEVTYPAGFSPNEGQTPPKVGVMSTTSGSFTDTSLMSSPNTTGSAKYARKANWPKIYGVSIKHCRQGKDVWHQGKIDFGKGNAIAGTVPYYFQVQRHGNNPGGRWEYAPITLYQSWKNYQFNWTDQWREDSTSAQPIRYRLMYGRHVDKQLWISANFRPADIGVCRNANTDTF